MSFGVNGTLKKQLYKISQYNYIVRNSNLFQRF